MRPSTQGYDAQAPDLVARYESVSFEDGHTGILDLVPSSPCRVLDVGAGSGRDAAWFAARGDTVTAVEPTAEMRVRGQALHVASRIEWIEGRRMFEVSADETIAHAAATGLTCVRRINVASERTAGMRWDRLWFIRAA